MKHRVMIALGALCVLMRAHRARAEDAPEEITVRGSQAGGFASRARLEDAPREITDAASLVDPLPGVHVRRLGADDSFSTLSIRGSSSTEVAVYLAGVPLTGGADPTLDLATLPLWPGARARVFRSFAPAAMGPGSLGGTLALDPPTATGPERTEVWAAAGAFGSRRMRVADVRAFEDGSRVAMALSASRSDDDFSYYDPLQGAFASRQNAGHAQVGALVGWSIPVRLGGPSPGRLTVTTLAQARRQELAGNVFVPTPHQRLESDRELAAVELTAPADRGAWIARAWARRDGLRLDDHPTEAQGSSPTHTDDAIAAVGGAAGWRGRPRRDLQVDARIDGSGERFAPGAWLGGASAPPGASRATAGLASDMEWRATDALTATTSGRIDASHDRGGEAATATDEIRPTGHVGGELRAGPLAIASHAGALARAPSFIERYGDRGAFVGDPTLRSESAWTVDLGARAATRTGPLALGAEVVGFGTWARDLIVFVPTSFGSARAQNVGRARLAGLELEVDARLADLRVHASYTGLATENDSECASSSLACERPPLAGRPAHDLTADASYDIGPLRLRYGLDVVTGIYADLTGTRQVPARALQSAGARLDVPHAPGLRVALDVRNLFDVRTGLYDGAFGPERAPIGDVFAYPIPGRSALVSVRWSQERDPGRVAK